MDPGLTPAPDSVIFVSDLEDGNKKKNIPKFFCLLLFKATLTPFFNDKKS
jgi:hypothetical protein